MNTGKFRTISRYADGDIKWVVESKSGSKWSFFSGYHTYNEAENVIKNQLVVRRFRACIWISVIIGVVLSIIFV